jgi:hypothetical protein
MNWAENKQRIAHFVKWATVIWLVHKMGNFTDGVNTYNRALRNKMTSCIPVHSIATYNDSYDKKSACAWPSIIQMSFKVQFIVVFSRHDRFFNRNFYHCLTQTNKML